MEIKIMSLGYGEMISNEDWSILHDYELRINMAEVEVIKLKERFRGKLDELKVKYRLTAGDSIDNRGVISRLGRVNAGNIEERETIPCGSEGEEGL